jgi:hypothetical protein
VLTYRNDLAKDSLAYKALLRWSAWSLVGPTLRRSAGIIATSDHYLRGSRRLPVAGSDVGGVHYAVKDGETRPARGA